MTETFPEGSGQHDSCFCWLPRSHGPSCSLQKHRLSILEMNFLVIFDEDNSDPQAVTRFVPWNVSKRGAHCEVGWPPLLQTPVLVLGASLGE